MEAVMHLIQPHGIDPIIPSEIIETPAIFSLSFFCAIYLSIAPVLLITCLHFVCFFIWILLQQYRVPSRAGNQASSCSSLGFPPPPPSRRADHSPIVESSGNTHKQTVGPRPRQRDWEIQIENTHMHILSDQKHQNQGKIHYSTV